ncbi:MULTISPECIES: hypothetical protein [Rhizobium]|uniref:Uncharacterized protein n=1 Tax=Rhizobium rhododendri TaxID=2506430 RepID=A0ABY8ICB2_9HYPH|nr:MULTISPECIES: hypothetical protein [Rhizobium]MBO9098952.1 hypothetical protein [Rhizobium sp. L58/93]MBO9132243.1 hypothetical protein [Rhizobium sp. B209b/85]MBO9169216.1 hypothetical protein [Rhizobium sp. L245/93]MBO9185166.1 hypothetical protein [Rhizobium sp. E27B/91]MBZ5758587.1 hypothetical protein [Rhizobium sp. VS19-DR96]
MSDKKAAEKLQYGNRFGNDIVKLANASLSLASQSSESEIAAAKYARWFSNGEVIPEPSETSRARFRKILPTMDAIEVASATRENLSILGNDAHDLFSDRLPANNRMRKANRSSVLPSIPYLGSCKFGEVVVGQSSASYSVLQLFIANFDGEFDTSAGASFYKPNSREFDQMFFGVHVVVDRDGNPLGFDRKRGVDGIAFKTKDLNKALYNVAAAATGLSMEQLKARAQAAARKR